MCKKNFFYCHMPHFFAGISGECVAGGVRNYKKNRNFANFLRQKTMLHHSTQLRTILSTVPGGQLFVLTDSHTAVHCLPLLAESIGKIPYHVLTIEAGEESKCLSSVQVVWDFLLKHHATREAMLINLGGGMVTDLGGFAAATYMRGIRFVNIPTTLLAMVDASSGGKTGFDYQVIKNVIGSFTQPEATLIDPDFLRTLPVGELLSGLAEMFKHGLIASPRHWQELLAWDIHGQDIATLAPLIADSIAIKERIVAADPQEKNIRRTLNFGHTIGHGIEAVSQESESPLYHGECVALGMIPMCNEKIRPRVIEVLKKCNLYRTLDYNWEKITEAAFHDKKADGDSVTVITVSEIGSFEMKKMNCLDVINMAKTVLEGLGE